MEIEPESRAVNLTRHYDLAVVGAGIVGLLAMIFGRRGKDLVGFLSALF